MDLKRCPECGFQKPLDEFPKIRRRTAPIRRSVHTPTGSGVAVGEFYRKRICKVCTVTRNAAYKRANLYRETFRRRRRDHARRLGVSVEELHKLGWEIERRTIEMRAYHEDGFCPGCLETDGTKHFFRDMEHGLGDMTIDIIDPAKPPIWPGNVQWLCNVCNRRKRTMSPILHGQRILAEREFERAELAEPIIGQLSLLE
jgi:hypothetical protein